MLLPLYPTFIASFLGKKAKQMKLNKINKYDYFLDWYWTRDLPRQLQGRRC